MVYLLAFAAAFPEDNDCASGITDTSQSSLGDVRGSFATYEGRAYGNSRLVALAAAFLSGQKDNKKTPKEGRGRCIEPGIRRDTGCSRSLTAIRFFFLKEDKTMWKRVVTAQFDCNSREVIIVYVILV